MYLLNSTSSPFANLVSACTTDLWVISLLAVAVGAVYVVLTAITSSVSKCDGNVYEPGGIPIISTWSFFVKRHDFIIQTFAKSGANMFRFRMLQYSVTVLKGESARKWFFNNQTLGIFQGYAALLAAVPIPKTLDIKSSEHERLVLKHILGFSRKDTVTDALPLLLDDLHTRMSEWGSKGVINPFNNVHDLVLQLTVRMTTCRELAEDRNALEKISAYYLVVEKCATPIAFHFPWFPGIAKIKKAKAAASLYLLLSRYVKLRRESNTSSADPIDFLIRENATDKDIIVAIMIALLAGLADIAPVSCWILMHLGINSEWKGKAITEYKNLVAKYTDTLSTEPLYKRLSSVPLHAWEMELPSVDLIIQETIRMNTNLTALRRNVGKDMSIDGAMIKKGDFVVYPLYSAHMDDRIFTDPMTFDPGRYLEGREEDKKEVFAFGGWGGGRHPCAGAKIAKLQMKLILASILLGYKYEVVDKFGNHPHFIPEHDRNNIQKAQPLGDPLHIKIKFVFDEK